MMMERRRVVVTGVGTVNAIASGGLEAVVGALDGGRSGIGPVRAFLLDGSPSRLAAEVSSAAIEPHLDPDATRRLSRICQLAVAAGRLAVADSGVPVGPGLGVVIGTEHGDFRSSAEFASGYLRRGPAGLSPMIFPNTVMNAMAGQTAIAVGARGPTVTVNQATVAGDLAVARAAALIAAGHAEAVLAGGTDEICEVVYQRLARMGALSPMGRKSPEGCRPFAPDHNGPVLGEGATFVVLEEGQAARERGARIIGTLLAAAWGNIPAPPHSAPRWRRDRPSILIGVLDGLRLRPGELERCYGSGNGDPSLDDWEMALLSTDLSGCDAARALIPPRCLAPLFGQHGGLGALRAAAAALEARRSARPVVAHGIARGGCRTAIVMGPP
jgi:3-oxoacyl-[acyl-carrier-protein] synthase II